ncbi:MAG TPA: efflux RND transporter permease subunit, partial [Candidatus Woesebacteria bacterium]|nr:efflux RND transporter permease subunit [Candidatus Woesebacteria bacterium]
MNFLISSFLITFSYRDIIPSSLILVNIKMNNNLVTRFSELFFKRNRLTILLTISVLLLGFYSYTTLLKREGFPVINLPIIIVNTPYLSGDPAKTEADITGKISSSITEIEGVKEIQTTSTSNLSSIFVSLDEG